MVATLEEIEAKIASAEPYKVWFYCPEAVNPNAPLQIALCSGRTNDGPGGFIHVTSFELDAAEVQQVFTNLHEGKVQVTLYRDQRPGVTKYYAVKFGDDEEIIPEKWLLC